MLCRRLSDRHGGLRTIRIPFPRCQLYPHGNFGETRSSTSMQASLYSLMLFQQLYLRKSAHVRPGRSSQRYLPTVSDSWLTININRAELYFRHHRILQISDICDGWSSARIKFFGMGKISAPRFPHWSCEYLGRCKLWPQLCWTTNLTAER